MKTMLVAATAAAALLAAGSASAATNLIANGGFVGQGNGASFQTVGVGNAAIPEWDVLTGDVDWITGYWPGSDGDGYSVDLNGNNPGTIGQSITTSAGHFYTLTFDIAANPDFSGPRVAIVGANGVEIGSETFSLNQGQPVAWDGRTLTFQANSSSTLITFASGTTTNCCYGAAIDNVSVTLGVPEASTWALMILGFGGAGAMLRRRQAAVAA